MKRLRVLILMDEDYVPPETIEGLTPKQMAPWKTEYDVTAAIHNLGHEARPMGVAGELGVIGQGIRDFKPHVVFNLLEEFRGLGTYVPYVLAYLELMHQQYTGCNPRGLIFAENKALARKILKYHRIPSPDFFVVPLSKRTHRPARLQFPLIVKSVSAHGSVGIAQASVVHDDEKLSERVAFVHEQLQTDAIVEEYIDGRELYVGLIGNHRLATLPIWELHFDNLPEGAPRIATERVKWSHDYQKRAGIRTEAASDLPKGTEERILRLCKRAYRALDQTGYARMDLRLTESGRIVLLESNPNPQLAYGEDFAEAAHAVGIEYEPLIQRILQLALRHPSGSPS